ncbi:anti-sigma factor family protein [Arthrobacter sp. H14]|uniref:anti-sigma factor family protein n=1 Tax=Arthrobacter sp. H14 TaxID=1312959 RepID=UPI0004B3BA97|nr:zf-HC2 domain-containing protein [Arthrobacter sp. H14]
MKPDHDEIQHSIGAYVLGGLEPSDRAVLEDHLRKCTDCRVEYENLNRLPALLDTLDSAEADSTGNSGGTQARGEHEMRAVVGLMDKIARRRRQERRRAGVLVAAAAAAFFAMGIMLGPVINTPEQTVDQFTMSGESGAVVEVDLVHKQWGTEIVLDGEDLPTSGELTLWITSSNGTVEEVATWSATDGGVVRLTGATATKPEQIAGVSVGGSGQGEVASVTVDIDAADQTPPPEVRL